MEALTWEPDYYKNQLERSWQELAMLSHLAEMVSLGGDSKETNSIVLKKVVDLMKGNFGYIYLVDKGERTISLASEYFPHAKPLPESATNVVLDEKINRPVHQVILTGKGMIIDNIWEDHALMESLAAYADTIKQFGSSVLAPLRMVNKNIGVICVSAPKERMFHREDILMLEAVGCILGVALYNTGLIDDLRRSKEHLSGALRSLDHIRETERKRVSRELHDGAGQALTSMLLQLKALQEESDVEVIHDRINGLRFLTSNTLEEIRSLTSSLRISNLVKDGLPAALRKMIKEFSRISGINILFEVSENIFPLPEEIDSIAYRIVQEGITNIIRHSKASFAAVKLYYLHIATEFPAQKEVGLEICDNGVGFTLEENKVKGSGIIGIEERVGAINGSFALMPMEKGGTKLSIRLPVQDGQEQGDG
ncbi:GAF domain-containing sensor histidine kinase [Treponema primitia]|nr:GAF domain-containing sensor histidine kinase [Treponema primitia]